MNPNLEHEHGTWNLEPGTTERSDEAFAPIVAVACRRHPEVDEELAFHIEMRTRELVEKGVDPRIAREMVLARIGDATRLKRTCVDLGRKRDREMRINTVARGTPGRCEVRVAAIEGVAGVHDRRGGDAGARHRRQQRDVRACRRDVDASPSVPRMRIAWSWCGSVPQRSLESRCRQ